MKSEIFIIIIGAFILQLGCKSETKEVIAAVEDRTAMPKLHATDITTVVSDSGITRYRISAPVWNMYDKAAQPYWEFPQGIHFERFDSLLSVDANIHSNYAHYNERDQIWTLQGQ
ncbi:MAG: LPS export ABC transporter periplasmic protein LptC, partial [Prevotellaceae bacterium]|nr:LPS export ABC transporter periplasmic protein LptC [Prevotellaceae bacterium]